MNGFGTGEHGALLMLGKHAHTEPYHSPLRSNFESLEVTRTGQCTQIYVLIDFFCKYNCFLNLNYIYLVAVACVQAYMLQGGNRSPRTTFGSLFLYHAVLELEL